MTLAWATHYRSDIHEAVIMSPAFGFDAIPTPLTRLAMRIALLLPNAFNWWDKALKENGSPPHFYPRYSTRACSGIEARLFSAGCAAARQAGGESNSRNNECQ